MEEIKITKKSIIVCLLILVVTFGLIFALITVNANFPDPVRDCYKLCEDNNQNSYYTTEQCICYAKNCKPTKFGTLSFDRCSNETQE